MKEQAKKISSYRVVFTKLDEAEDREVAALLLESEEVAELRRLVLEVTDPDPPSYTTT